MDISIPRRKLRRYNAKDTLETIIKTAREVVLDDWCNEHRIKDGGREPSFEKFADNFATCKKIGFGRESVVNCYTDACAKCCAMQAACSNLLGLF